MEKECEWKDWSPRNGEKWWEEQCVAHHQLGNTSCVRYRCRYCKEPIGMKGPQECPGSRHILFKLALRVSRGESVHGS